MTPLSRPVTRRALVTKDAGKRIVVTLYPGDTIGMRVERGRKQFTASLQQVYRAMAQWHVERTRIAKQKARKDTRK